MDHHSVPVTPELAPLVEAAERGDTVVITRDGQAVAEVRPAVRRRGGTSRRGGAREWLAGLAAVQAKVPSAARGGAGLVRRMRDMDDH